MGFKPKPPSASSKRLSVRGRRRRLGFVHANDRRALQVNNGILLTPGRGSSIRQRIESRQRIVNKITDTLQRHMPPTSSDGMIELRRIALRFEEKIYTVAATQQDYLRKISLKMLSLETKAHGSAANLLPPNSPDGGNQKNLDRASMDALSQIGQSTGVDWQEKVYQRLQTMKEIYYQDIKDLLTRLALKCGQPMAADQTEKLNQDITTLHHVMRYFHVQKRSIPQGLKEDKVDAFERQIVRVLSPFK